MTQLTIVYGTRPEYLKVLPIIKLLEVDSLIKFSVIRVLQHGNLDEPDLRYDFKVEVNTDLSVNRLDGIGFEILNNVGKYITLSDCVLVQGDTSTAFYCALLAFQNKVKIIHLEAGLRTYDNENPYPEEGYRQMISRIASIHLTPCQFNSNILSQEKVSGNIHTVGNTILDLVKSYNLTVSCGNTILVTFHRRENVVYLPEFVSMLKECIKESHEKKVIWFLHPNPELQKLVKSYTTDMNIDFIQPVEHRIFLEYLKDCFCVMTDSGGIQEEAAFLGKPTLVLRKITERNQIPEPYLQVVPPPYTYLTRRFESIPKGLLPPCYSYGDGNSASNVIKIIYSSLLI
jgi:UDP-N-acetylglucosamine 2-epimerase (non-hydrolysing)